MAKQNVYKALIPLPNRNEGDEVWDYRNKYFIVIRDNPNESDVVIVVASTDRNHQKPRGFEVPFPSTLELFPLDTIVDCRWIFTISRKIVQDQEVIFSIPDSKMEEIKLAVALGLELL